MGCADCSLSRCGPLWAQTWTRPSRDGEEAHPNERDAQVIGVRLRGG